MIEPLNHVLATQTPRVPPQTATGDSGRAPVEAPPAHASAEAPKSPEFKLFGADGFDVFDVLDMINPLQHVPVISTIYRRLTGDELSPGARIVGATLLGGPIGAALAMADSAVEYETGKDAGANIYAALFGNEGPIPAADIFVAARAAAPWQDPDLVPETVTANGTSAAFVAAATPDLGALSEFTTGAGQRVTLEANPTPQTAPFIAAAWKDPDLEPLDAPSLALIAQMNVDTLAIEAGVHEQTVTTSVADARTSTAVAAPNPATINVDRPMPSDAAKAQAINALAAMPTSQTAAAVAELSKTDPRPGPRHHMAPPAGDIPRGAAASLARKATNAYATSMAAAKPTKAEAAAAAEVHNAQAVAALERSTTDAQNDWMLDAMQRAMAKYEASAKLRMETQGADGQINAGGIAVTR